MFGRIVVGVLAFSLVCTTPHAFGAPGDERANKSVSTGPRRHLANIIFAGLAGAVLGLSTLSFYGRPQDKLNNIALGAAVGIIGGTLFSTYKAASEPREFYGENEHRPELWTEWEPLAAREATPRMPLFGYSFEF